MNSKPLFSVVTVTLNSEFYLEETIESVLSQDYPHKELIIIDGGSYDKTIEIIKKHKKFLRWISEPDNGIADAMNKGIKLAKGDIISHLHSDDRYESGTLNKVANSFAEYPQNLWLIGNGNYIDEKGEVVKNVRLKKYNYRRLSRLNCLFHPSVFLKKEIFEKIGFFNPQLSYVMDYDMWLRIGTLFEPIQTEAYLASFRVHKKSLSINENIRAFDEEWGVRKNNLKKNLTLSDYIRYKLLRLIKYYKPI